MDIIEQEHLLANLHTSVLHHYENDETVHLSAVRVGSSKTGGKTSAVSNSGIGERQILTSSSSLAAVSMPQSSNKKKMKDKRRRDTNSSNKNNNNRPTNTLVSVHPYGVSMNDGEGDIAGISNNHNNVHHKRRRKRTPNMHGNGGTASGLVAGTDGNNHNSNHNNDNEIEDEDPADEELDAEDEDYDEEEDHDHDDEEHDRRQPDRLDDVSKLHIPFWDTYDSINQIYLEMGK